MASSGTEPNVGGRRSHGRRVAGEMRNARSQGALAIPSLDGEY